MRENTDQKNPEYKHFLRSVNNNIILGFQACWWIPELAQKTYLTLLKKFLNNKKIRCIPQFYHNNKYYNNFKENADLSKQCILVDNSSIHLTDSSKITSNSLSTIPSSKDDIAKVNKSLDSRQVYDHDMISICMWKLSGESILKTLELLYSGSALNGENILVIGKG